MLNLTKIGFLLALFISAPLLAAPLPGDTLKQSTDTAESVTNEVRWYQVEILIFKQMPLSSEINEFWPKNIVLSYPDDWETLKTPDQYQAMYQKSPLVNTPFILLDKKYFQLTAIEKKLQLNRNAILFHGAWRQSLTQNLDQKTNVNVPSILIRGGNTFDDHSELEGSISLSLLRYLHLRTNLWLSTFGPIKTTDAKNATASTSDNKEAEVAIESWPELPIFPLLNKVTTEDSSVPAPERKYQVEEIFLNKQSRRMRSYETHYIDHPKFGIVIRMVPLDTNTLQPIPRK